MTKKIKRIIKKPLPRVKAEPVKKTKIRVIGIGGGGGSIVSEIASRIKKASFLVANTDLQVLRQAGRKVIRFQFGQNLTQGLGTGMNVELGEMAAQNEKERIKKLLSGQDLCIIIACLGGGTGSGAAPIFAKIAKNLGNISYGIFTLPFKFEGEKKAQIAREALEKLKPNLNTLSIIPNERIFQIVEKNTPLKIALSTINKNLAESLEDLIEIIYEPGLINIDFADLRTIFEGKGRLTYLNSVEISGIEKDEDLIKKVLSSPLYPYTIRGAKGILFNIVGEKNLELSEVSKISKAISDSVNREAKIIFGIAQKKFHDHKHKERKVKITILATGSSQRIFPTELKKVRKKAVLKKVKPEKKKKRVVKKLIPASQRDKSLFHPSLRSGEEKKPQPPKTQIKTHKRKKIKRKKREIEEDKSSSFPTKSRLRDEGGKERKALFDFAVAQEVKSQPSPPKKKEGEEKNLLQPLPVQNKIEVKIRRNALEIKKDVEAEEKELIAEENKWETPAFLRRKFLKKNYPGSENSTYSPKASKIKP